MSQGTDDACSPGSQGHGSQDHASPKQGDSAGVPWEGRSFESNPHAGDDGSADPALLDALCDSVQVRALRARSSTRSARHGC